MAGPLFIALTDVINSRRPALLLTENSYNMLYPHWISQYEVNMLYPQRINDYYVMLKTPEHSGYKAIYDPLHPQWLSDNRTLLFTLDAIEPDTNIEFRDLWAMDTKDLSLRQLTYGLIVIDYAVSPVNDDWVVFAGLLPYEQKVMLPGEKRLPVLDLWLYNIREGQPIRLTHGDDDYHYPQWSPDGSQIVFYCEHNNLYAAINLKDGKRTEVYQPIEEVSLQFSSFMLLP